MVPRADGQQRAQPCSAQSHTSHPCRATQTPLRADGLKVTAHPEEVDDTKWVTHEELLEMMKPESGLLWSPWFRIIVERFLVHWWADLDATFSSDSHTDYAKIHRFDPTAEHMGGGGKAGPWLDVTAEADVGKGLTAAPKQ